MIHVFYVVIKEQVWTCRRFWNRSDLLVFALYRSVV
jgi:hypothetical protein